MKILSFFLTPEIHQNVANGSISFAPVDFAISKGEISLELLVKILESRTGVYDRAELPFLVQTKMAGMKPENADKMPYDKVWAPISMETEATESDKVKDN